MGERIKVTANKPLSTKENSASNKQKTGFRSQSSHVDQILFLQRTIGNQAVQRLIKSGALQAKLRIGQPGDKYEQEADRVADAVMRMPEPGVQRQVEPEEEEEEMLQTKPLAGQITPLVQRQIEPEEEEEEEMLQAQSREDATSEVPNDLESHINAIRGGGRPLAESERGYFEPRFGHDFGWVRIHTGSKAAESALMLNARAYTLGHNVVFGAGQYAPQTQDGKKLFAHELTHVVQQNVSAYSTSGPDGSTLAQRARNITENILQRRLVINPADSIPMPPGVFGPPTPLTIATQGLLADTCPDGNFRVDTSSGVVTPSDAAFCQWPGIPYRGNLLKADLASTPTGCRCICDVINHARTTNIDFRAGGPTTSPGSRPGAGPGHGGVQTDPTIRMDPRFQGQYRIAGRWVDIPFHLIFSHELCGHALPKMEGTHAHRGPAPPGGTPPHERHAVDVERDIAAEHNPPLPRRPEDYGGDARQRP